MTAPGPKNVTDLSFDLVVPIMLDDRVHRIGRGDVERLSQLRADGTARDFTYT
jgi:hypothetical protein